MFIKIHNLEWEFKYVSEEELQIVIGTMAVQGPCGLTDRSKLIMYVNKDLKKDLLKRSITHEIVHGCFWSYGVIDFEQWSEENICNFIETHIDEIYSLTQEVYDNFLEQEKV